jgi:hypothetical protein
MVIMISIDGNGDSYKWYPSYTHMELCISFYGIADIETLGSQYPHAELPIPTCGVAQLRAWKYSTPLRLTFFKDAWHKAWKSIFKIRNHG